LAVYYDYDFDEKNRALNPMSPTKEFFYIYTAAVYTIVELVSTIGYGDIVPVATLNILLFMLY